MGQQDETKKDYTNVHYLLYKLLILPIRSFRHLSAVSFPLSTKIIPLLSHDRSIDWWTHHSRRKISYFYSAGRRFYLLAPNLERMHPAREPSGCLGTASEACALMTTSGGEEEPLLLRERSMTTTWHEDEDSPGLRRNSNCCWVLSLPRLGLAPPSFCSSSSSSSSLWLLLSIEICSLFMQTSLRFHSLLLFSCLSFVAHHS